MSNWQIGLMIFAVFGIMGLLWTLNENVRLLIVHLSKANEGMRELRDEIVRIKKNTEMSAEYLYQMSPENRQLRNRE